MTNIVLVGIQGSGKGTQARKILDKNIAIDRLLHRRIDPETGETFPESFE